MASLTSEINIAEIEKVKDLVYGTVFFRKGYSSVWMVIRLNCYTERLLKHEATIDPPIYKDPVLVINLSSHLITPLDGDELVVIAEEAKIVAK